MTGRRLNLILNLDILKFTAPVAVPVEAPVVAPLAAPAKGNLITYFGSIKPYRILDCFASDLTTSDTSIESIKLYVTYMENVANFWHELINKLLSGYIIE